LSIGHRFISGVPQKTEDRVQRSEKEDTSAERPLAATEKIHDNPACQGGASAKTG